MNRLKIYNVNLSEVGTVVKESVKSCEGPLTLPVEDKYHSCARIEAIPSILKNGLLSKRLQRGILTLDEEYRFSDPCCVNGADCVSLSTMTPEVPFSKMYRDEDYYDSYNTPFSADFVISGDVSASSVTTNYFNELLVDNGVSPSYFTGINVRVLREIEKIESSNASAEDKAQKILKLYDALREAAAAVTVYNFKREDGGIPLMEDSNRPRVTLSDLQAGKEYTNEGVIGLDSKKVSELSKIYVK